MTVEELLKRQQPRRKVQGMAAALLPYESDGRVAVDAFAKLLTSTHRAGLMNAVNMDTGYVNYLSDREREEVLVWTRQALGKGVPFVAGAYIEHEADGEIVKLYRRQIDTIVGFDGIPILFQTARLHGQASTKIAEVYRDICRDYPHVLAFELGPMFAASGEIWNLETIRRLMDIAEIRGMKHSSLDRILELERLALRDKHRPEFRIYTGNDLGINMIEFGSDYLLGLAAFAPEKFAERDRLWEAGDLGYYALSDALQYLGSAAFRAPVPAYKHSAAVFLNLIGRIPSDRTHPNNPQRPAWEAEMMGDCARRLALL
jgi:dihydrodipicolinate synthase/N-acetylneuraminate lyase